jgi:predicted nucleic acid-binding protein
MIVIDSSGWLEYFADGPNAPAFAELIEGSEEVVVPAAVLFEVGRRVWQQRGEDAALEAMSVLAGRAVVPLDSEVAVLAVRVGVQHRLAMADSLILATARALGAVLWSQDADFDNVPDVRFVPKPTL